MYSGIFKTLLISPAPAIVAFRDRRSARSSRTFSRRCVQPSSSRREISSRAQLSSSSFSWSYDTFHFTRDRRKLSVFDLHYRREPLHLIHDPTKRSHGSICRANADDSMGPWSSLFDDSSRSMFEEQFRMIDRMQRDMDSRFQAAEMRMRGIDALEERATGRFKEGNRVEELQGNNWRQWRREFTDNGPGRHVYYSESITTYGIPYSSWSSVPASGMSGSMTVVGLLGGAVVLGAWGALTAAFARNYHTTIYSRRWKWVLLALWPVLVLLSPRFRGQWRRVVRGIRKMDEEKSQREMNGAGPMGDNQRES